MQGVCVNTVKLIANSFANGRPTLVFFTEIVKC